MSDNKEPQGNPWIKSALILAGVFLALLMFVTVFDSKGVTAKGTGIAYSDFRAKVVSGQVKQLKPEPAIYRLLLDRNGLAAGDCVFIDDSIANVEGARAVGMDAIHFTGAEALSRELAARGLL